MASVLSLPTTGLLGDGGGLSTSLVDIFSCINRERYWTENTFRGLGSGGVMLAEPRMWSLHAEGHQSVVSLCMSQWCWPREQSQRACPGSKGSGLCRQGIVVGALPLGAGGLFSAFCLPCPCVSFPPPRGDRQASRAQGTSWVASSSTVPLHTSSTHSDPQFPFPAWLPPERQTPASSCFLHISTSMFNNRTLRFK